MKDLRFEWDERKAESNLSKHGVSFEEAKTVFYDDAALVISARKATRNEASHYRR